jgi:hypothetical protein
LSKKAEIGIYVFEMRVDQDSNQDKYVSLTSMPFKDYWTKSTITNLGSNQKKTMRLRKEISIFWGLIKIVW